MSVRAFAVSALVIGSLMPAQAQDAMKTVSELAAKWETAYDAGDAAAIAAMFTADGVLNAPSGAVLKGREAIEKGLAGRIKAGWTKETVTATAGGAAGDAIWAVGDYAIFGSGENAGKQTGGHWGEVLVRDGGQWKIGMLTANVAPPK